MNNVIKKKVCFVVAQPGTAYSFFKTPMEKLKEEFEVFLVANITDEHIIEQLPLDGYKSIRIERRPNLFVDIKALFQLYHYFYKERFFVVHSMSSKPSILTCIAGYMARIPHRIRTFTGQLWCNMVGIKRFFFKSIDRLTVMLNTDILADGHPQARYLIEQRIVKTSQIKVLANGSICGVDTERFKYDNQIRSRIREELGLSDKIVYVFLGRLKKEKGIHELFSAFDLIVQECSKAVLLLVGQDEENCLSWLPEYLNIKNGENFIFYGYTSRPNEILMAGDVFCNPSYREGFGLSVLEASCLGLPVICSDVYGMEDTMVEGITGLRCKVRDVNTLADCMRRLYDNSVLRKVLGTNGHNRVVKDFSRELVTKAWYEYYKNLR